MAATEDADPPLGDDFEPDFPPQGATQQAPAGAPDGSPDDSLVAAFEDWDTTSRAEPSMQMVNLLTELLNLVEAWRSEGAKSNKRLEARVLGELKGVQSGLETIRTTETDAQQSYKQALRSLWQQTQELSTGVQGLAAGSNQDDGSQLILSELTLVKDRILEVAVGIHKQDQLVAGRLSELEAKAQAAEARAEELARQTEQIHTRLNEGVESLEQKASTAFEAQESLQNRLVRVLEEVDRRMSQQHEQLVERADRLQEGVLAIGKSVTGDREALARGLKDLTAVQSKFEAKVAGGLEALEGQISEKDRHAAGRAEQLTTDLKQGLTSLRPAGSEVKTGFETLARAVGALREDLAGAGERHQSNLLERIGALEAEVAGRKSEGTEQREQLSSAVSTFTDALKQLRAEIKQEADHSETRIRRQLESVESQTLQAIAEVGASLRSEQRASKLDIETRIDRGVREPLKATVTLLNRQLSEIEATVDRTFDTLRNADLSIRIDNMDALIESRLRSRKPDEVVVLPAGAKTPPADQEDKKTD